MAVLDLLDVDRLSKTEREEIRAFLEMISQVPEEDELPFFYALEITSVMNIVGSRGYGHRL